jgi:FkbM family methyltransferase
LYYRHGTSDLDVIHQIYIQQEYAPLCNLHDVRLVVDCGANAGYSSAFFLEQFPSCRVIAVEPDSGNFDMLKRNLRAFGRRADPVRAGIWSRNVPLRISPGHYRDGREWTVQVQPCEAGQAADFQGLGIASLLASSGFERISLLKMDIEGAEAIVFQGELDWLDRVDAMAIELHDDSAFGNATEIFHAAIHGRGFEVSHSGELTICRRSPRQAK